MRPWPLASIAGTVVWKVIVSLLFGPLCNIAITIVINTPKNHIPPPCGHSVQLHVAQACFVAGVHGMDGDLTHSFRKLCQCLLLARLDVLCYPCY